MDYRQPDLSVITVNYNGFHDTCEFIDSWAATVFSVSYEMIVIDNGSTANEAALLQKTYPFIQAVRSERNLGFAGGNNLGINLAKGKYLFLLNNDVCMVKDAIPLLIKRLLSSDKIAGVSPLIRDYAEPHAIQFAGYTQLSPITLPTSSTCCSRAQGTILPVTYSRKSLRTAACSERHCHRAIR